jgi:hypothetical protein
MTGNISTYTFPFIYIRGPFKALRRLYRHKLFMYNSIIESSWLGTVPWEALATHGVEIQLRLLGKVGLWPSRKEPL